MTTEDPDLEERETASEADGHDADLCEVDVSVSGETRIGSSILKAAAALGAALLIAMAVNHNIHAAASEEELFISEYMTRDMENTTEEEDK